MVESVISAEFISSSGGMLSVVTHHPTAGALFVGIRRRIVRQLPSIFPPSPSSSSSGERLSGLSSLSSVEIDVGDPTVPSLVDAETQTVERGHHEDWLEMEVRRLTYCLAVREDTIRRMMASRSAEISWNEP